MKKAWPMKRERGVAEYVIFLSAESVLIINFKYT